MGSKRFSLNGVDLIKMGKGLLIAAGGAALTYVSTPLITAGLAVVVNAFRKFVTDGSSDEQPAEPAA